jgi:hypothetical protein
MCFVRGFPHAFAVLLCVFSCQPQSALPCSVCVHMAAGSRQAKGQSYQEALSRTVSHSCTSLQRAWFDGVQPCYCLL